MKYWAFLSYSHTDAKWGDWLHKALETYRVPRRLIGKESRDGKIPARLFPIFRDREELPVSADLPSNINEALRGSRYLIVICSPRAAQSRWVGEEIKAFKKLGREDRILALIVDGEPNASDGKPGFASEDECFPEPMRYRLGAAGQCSSERTEPIAADARENKDGRNNAKLKLLAGLLGVNYDELKQREHRRVFHRRIVTSFAALLILAFVGGVWTWQEIRQLHLKVEEQKRREALQQEQQRILRARTSDAYLNEAAGYIEKKDFATALGYLGSAVRYNPRNRPAVFQLTALFSEHNFWTPVVKAMHHRDFVFTVGFSPDGKRLVTGSSDQVAQIWDAGTGEPATPPLKEAGQVVSAVFNNDGTKVLTSSGNVWDSNNGRLLKHVGGGVFSRDGAVVVSPVGDGAVAQIMDTETGRVLATADAFRFLKVPGISMNWTLSLSGDGSKLLLAGVPLLQGATIPAAVPGRVALWDVSARRFLWGPMPMSDLSHGYGSYITPDGQHVILLASDRTIELRDAQTGELQRTFSARAPVVVSRLSPDAKTLIAVEHAPTEDPSTTIEGWQISDGQQDNRSFAGLRYEWIQDIVWWPNRSVFFEAPSGVVRSAVDGQEEGRVCDRDLSLSCAQFSPNGQQVLTGSQHGKVRLWHSRLRAPIKTTLLNGEKINSFVASRNGHRIAAWIGDGGRLWLLDGENFRALSESIKFPGEITGCQLSPDGKALAVAAYEGTWKPRAIGDKVGRMYAAEPAKEPPRISIMILDGDRARPIGPKLSVQLSTRDMPSLRTEDIVWSADCSKFAIVSSEIVAVYDLASGEMRRYDDGERFLVSGQFSPDLKYLYIFDEDGVLRWDLTTNGKPIRLITAATDLGSLSPDGNTLALATASVGGSFQLLNASDGKPIGTSVNAWSGKNSNITSLAFSLDSKRLLATTWQGAFRIWDVATTNALTENTQTDRLSSATFIESGDVIMTTTRRGVDFWSNDGRHLADEIETASGGGAEICSNGNNVIFANDEGHLMTCRMPARSCDAPEWLGDLAEATCGWRLNDAGVLESIEDAQPEKLEEVYSKIRSSPDGSPLKDWAMTLVVP